VRFRHIGKRPQVSATHLPGEELAVTVHGHAVPVDIHSDAPIGCSPSPWHPTATELTVHDPAARYALGQGGPT
jgi:hypothetical protein